MSKMIRSSMISLNKFDELISDEKKSLQVVG